MDKVRKKKIVRIYVLACLPCYILVEETLHSTFLKSLNMHGGVIEDHVIRRMKTRSPFVFMNFHQSTAYIIT